MCNNLEKKILTVCIPTYNRANNIKKNIIPLLNYFKGERNIHFLICNNDSKDNTNHLCKTLNKKFNNLSYFKISKKIDKEKFFEWSAKKVKSKFFFFLFDDDICLKKILEEVPNILLQSKNFSFLTFNRSMVYYSKDYPKKI
jgi:glycosyltransferase involved in cell wall biosynthesis